MAQNAEIAPCISIDGQPLEVVEDFCYLGSKISNDVLMTKDINNRIAKAISLLQKRVWGNALLTITTKCLVYRTCILSTPIWQ